MAIVELSRPEEVATLLLVAAICSYDPGTEPWVLLHDAADEIKAAIADPPGGIWRHMTEEERVSW